jgi:2Fe-2S ferredoxin
LYRWPPAGAFEFDFGFCSATLQGGRVFRIRNLTARPSGQPAFQVSQGAKMGGKNPYIEETKFTPATKKYKITFIKDGQPIEVDPDKVPYGHDGLPGSILDISQGFHKGLDHACGGVCACSTCHVIVHEGLESCNEATDAELDQLDEAPGVTPKSRLGCQCVPDGTKDIVVEIPDWNKNYAKEAEH